MAHNGRSVCDPSHPCTHFYTPVCTTTPFTDSHQKINWHKPGTCRQEPQNKSEPTNPSMYGKNRSLVFPKCRRTMQTAAAGQDFGTGSAPIDSADMSAYIHTVGGVVDPAGHFQSHKQNGMLHSSLVSKYAHAHTAPAPCHFAKADPGLGWNPDSIQALTPSAHTLAHRVQ
jgi:hypothetical protein